MYGKECVMNVEKNKNKENLNLYDQENRGERFGPKIGPSACDDRDVQRQVSESKVETMIADEGEAGPKNAEYPFDWTFVNFVAELIFQGFPDLPASFLFSRGLAFLVIAY